MDSRRKGCVCADGWTAEGWRELPNSVGLIYAQSRLALAGVTAIGQGVAVAVLLLPRSELPLTTALLTISVFTHVSTHYLAYIASDDGTALL